MTGHTQEHGTSHLRIHSGELKGTLNSTTVMDNANKLWQSKFPVVEIHWKNSAQKYGFKDTNSMQRYWSSCCNKEAAISMFPGKHAIMMATWEDSRKLLPFSDMPDLLRYVRTGYILMSSNFTYRKKNIGIITLNKRSLKMQPPSFVLICIDMKNYKIIGSFKLASRHGLQNFEDVEVFDCAWSPDETVISISISLIHNRHLYHESFENAIILYSCDTMKEIGRIPTIGQSLAAASFDPRHSHDTFAVAGVQGPMGVQMLATFTMGSGKPKQAVSIDGLLDIDADTHLELCYSREGEVIVMQVMDPVGFSNEWMYTTYLYNADTLEPLARYSPGLLRACHLHCIPLVAPLVSKCGTYMALANYSSLQKSDYHIRVYRLPVALSLKKQCRSAILRALHCKAGTSSLPLPTMLKDFLTWNRFSELKQGQQSERDRGCQCGGPEAGALPVVKDASWYTDITDVLSDPEQAEVPLHPRELNEVFS